MAQTSGGLNSQLLEVGVGLSFPIPLALLLSLPSLPASAGGCALRWMLDGNLASGEGRRVKDALQYQEMPALEPFPFEPWTRYETNQLVAPNNFHGSERDRKDSETMSCIFCVASPSLTKESLETSATNKIYLWGGKTKVGGRAAKNWTWAPN